MGKAEKTYERFMAQPPPKDITIEEVKSFMDRMGFQVVAGGRHPLKVTNPYTKHSMPVPEKGGIVDWRYIRMLQRMVRDIEEDEQP